MKNIAKILLISIGLVIAFYACEEEELGPVLDTGNITASSFSSPGEGTSYVLLRDQADSVSITFQWTAADFGMENLPGLTYTFQMDIADSNFNKPITLASSEKTSYTLTAREMNTKLLGKQLEPEVPVNIAFRVIAILTTELVDTSATLTLNFTPYSDIVEVNPIYLLGGATTAGWSNTNAIAAIYLPESGADSTFAVVDLLKPSGTGGSDGFVKFIRFLGAWAPQWGSDGLGTWESGNLVYRPDETVADPTPIPAPDVEDDYLIKVNIVSLTYEISETVQSLHLIGDATDAGWDNTAAIPMTKEAPGKYSLVANLDASASEGFKFLEFQGAWEPMIGRQADEPFDGGKINYRRVGDPDVPSIPPPPVTGSYLIEVDIAAGTYKCTPQ